MQDFPVANMNPEAMWLVGLLRTAGVEPPAMGCSSCRDTRRTASRSSSSYPLFGSKRARTASPASTARRVRGAVVNAPVANGRVTLPLTFAEGEKIAFEVKR